MPEERKQLPLKHALV